jgi:hypothetical protein
VDRLFSLDAETHEPPESRIGSANNARRFVNQLKNDDTIRVDRRVKLSGLLDGNSPWPHEKLKSLGQGHRANFNLREGEGAVEAAKTPYYDLVFEVPRFANIDFYFEEADSTTNQTWSEIISDEYHDVLDGWDGFDQNIQLHQWQMIVFGVGPLFWPHPLDWRSEAVKIGRVLVPDETKANVDELESVLVLHHYRADQLYRFIEHEKVGKSGRWDRELVEKAIIERWRTLTSTRELSGPGITFTG